MKTFQARYEGTRKLAPNLQESQVNVLSESGDVWQIYMPIDFTIGAPGQTPQIAKTHMNLVILRTSDGWKITAILPIPAAT